MPIFGEQEYSKEELEELVPKTNGHAHDTVLPQVQETKSSHLTEFPVYSIPEAEKHHMVLTKSTPVDYSHMINMITAWKDILNARLLALLSLTGAMIGFGFCMYEPDAMRLWGLGIYSVLTVWPVIALYHRKG